MTQDEISKDQNLKNLVNALAEFMKWQDEYQLVMSHTKEGDAARRLMDVLGIPADQVMVLIGGSNCPIFQRAADEIDFLRAQKGAAENRIDSMQRELDMLRAENEYLKNKPGVR